MEYGNTVVCPKCGGTVHIAVVISMMTFLKPTLHKFWAFGCEDCEYRMMHSAEEDVLPDRWFENYTGHAEMDERMAEELRGLID